MLFSSPTFLFYFLPAVLLLHALSFRLRDEVLLTASLFFYAWGEGRYVFFLIASIVLNYGFGLWIARQGAPQRRKLVLSVAIASNLSALAFFKYAAFAVGNLDLLLARAGLPVISIQTPHLPLGVSFFTFHAISYLVDVFRGTVPVEKNLRILGLYLAVFPQLIAGPIVRFKEIFSQLHNRIVTLPLFADGLACFVTGLAQKRLIADTLAPAADAVFAMAPSTLTPAHAWLGAAAFTLQIYFDFAGYSNMAIGMARMFGLRFPENFNYPYAAHSFTEFWRRWHMTLSSWFRDYLYIPLGGNHCGETRTYLNLVLVFFLCGLWHGANWTFITWGLFHGLFLVVERLGWGKVLLRVPTPFRHVYLLFFVFIGWVLFRSVSLHQAASIFGAMFGVLSPTGLVEPIAYILTPQTMMALVFGAFLSFPIMRTLSKSIRHAASAYRWDRLAGASLIAGTCQTVGFAILLMVCLADIASGTAKPFIYFRF